MKFNLKFAPVFLTTPLFLPTSQRALLPHATISLVRGSMKNEQREPAQTLSTTTRGRRGPKPRKDCYGGPFIWLFNKKILKEKNQGGPAEETHDYFCMNIYLYTYTEYRENLNKEVRCAIQSIDYQTRTASFRPFGTKGWSWQDLRKG